MKGLAFIALSFLLLMSSCEHFATLVFKVQNNCGTSLKVISKNNHFNKIETDTFIIMAGGLETIAVNDYGMRPVSYCKEVDDTLRDFTQINIFKNDTLSISNFLKSNRWEYKETNRYLADYVLVVTDADF